VTPISARRALTGAVALTPEEECAFFGTLCTSGGIWKRTARNRMDDVNAAFAAAYAGPAAPWIIDVGASSGITTVEWLRDLAGRGLRPSMVATDHVMDARLTRWDADHYVLTDHAGNVLQHEVAGRVMGAQEFALCAPPPGGDPAGGPVHAALAAVRRAYWRLAGGSAWHSRRVRLVSRHARAITFMHDDVLRTDHPDLRARFDALRAANLLNRCYFGPAELRQAIVNLRLRLRGPGAMLVVNRTWEDDSNHASIFVMDEAARFRVTARVGQGSEIEDIVLAADTGRPKP
jgi:hypothetical protein